MSVGYGKARLGREGCWLTVKMLTLVSIPKYSRKHTAATNLLVSSLFLRGNAFPTRPGPVSHKSTTAVCSPNASEGTARD